MSESGFHEGRFSRFTCGCAVVMKQYPGRRGRHVQWPANRFRHKMEQTMDRTCHVGRRRQSSLTIVVDISLIRRRRAHKHVMLATDPPICDWKAQRPATAKWIPACHAVGWRLVGKVRQCRPFGHT
jgi:hypothetical protein